jgi:hypothetical protein
MLFAHANPQLAKYIPPGVQKLIDEGKWPGYIARFEHQLRVLQLTMKRKQIGKNLRFHAGMGLLSSMDFVESIRTANEMLNQLESFIKSTLSTAIIQHFDVPEKHGEHIHGAFMTALMQIQQFGPHVMSSIVMPFVDTIDDTKLDCLADWFNEDHVKLINTLRPRIVNAKITKLDDYKRKMGLATECHNWLHNLDSTRANWMHFKAIKRKEIFSLGPRTFDDLIWYYEFYSGGIAVENPDLHGPRVQEVRQTVDMWKHESTSRCVERDTIQPDGLTEFVSTEVFDIWMGGRVSFHKWSKKFVFRICPTYLKRTAPADYDAIRFSAEVRLANYARKKINEQDAFEERRRRVMMSIAAGGSAINEFEDLRFVYCVDPLTEGQQQKREFDELNWPLGMVNDKRAKLDKDGNWATLYDFKPELAGEDLPMWNNGMLAPFAVAEPANPDQDMYN